MINNLCKQCPRNCNTRRQDASAAGYCRMPASPVIARAALHFWEEPCISGTNGSGTIFFSGCSLRCVFCQNAQISHGGQGLPISIERLAVIMKELEQAGAHNINFVNPTHYYEVIKEALSLYRPSIPLVYNSGGYDCLRVADEDLFDIYLIDCKFITPQKSARYCGAADYFSVCSALLKALYERIGQGITDENRIMQRGLMIRHLLMPGMTNEAIRIINWVAKYAHDATFSLMAQYLPCGKAADYPEINRRITQREYDKVCDALFEADLPHVYLQERSSAKDCYIPSFNGEGVLKRIE